MYNFKLSFPSKMTSFLLAVVFLSATDNGLANDNNGVFPLAGIEADLPFADLKPFGDMVSSAKVVGLGESVHTSGGYYQAKERLIRYLVEEKGFRVFGMETPWVNAFSTSAYVQSCEGDAATATKGVFRVFGDIATKDLFSWLCKFNRSHPQDPVVFFGYDIQEVETFTLILQALKEFSLDDSNKLETSLRQCAGFGYESTAKFWDSDSAKAIMSGKSPIPSDQTKICTSVLADIGRLAARLPAHASSYQRFSLERAAFSASSFQILLHNSSHGKFSEASLLRDEAMAANFFAFHKWLGTNKQAINWAHNYHLAQSLVPQPDGTLAKAMGVYFKEKYADEYMPFALSGYRVLINWPWTSVKYSEYPENPATLESGLHGSSYKHAFVDFKGSWLLPSVPYFLRDGDRVVPLDYYRGMFFLDESRANIYVE